MNNWRQILGSCKTSLLLEGNAYNLLKAFESSKPLSVQEIKNLKIMSLEDLSFRLPDLKSKGFIENISRGVYQITTKGKEELKRSEEKGWVQGWDWRR